MFKFLKYFFRFLLFLYIFFCFLFFCLFVFFFCHFSVFIYKTFSSLKKCMYIIDCFLLFFFCCCCCSWSCCCCCCCYSYSCCCYDYIIALRIPLQITVFFPHSIANNNTQTSVCVCVRLFIKLVYLVFYSCSVLELASRLMEGSVHIHNIHIYNIYCILYIYICKSHKSNTI